MFLFIYLAARPALALQKRPAAESAAAD
jgi:hypothetical protein